jgi:hypothetical protein
MKMLRVIYMRGKRETEFIFTSAYIPMTHLDHLPTTVEPENSSSSVDVMLAHTVHIIWVRTGTSPRGESLIQYLVKLIFFNGAINLP